MVKFNNNVIKTKLNPALSHIRVRFNNIGLLKKIFKDRVKSSETVGRLVAAELGHVKGITTAVRKYIDPKTEPVATEIKAPAESEIRVAFNRYVIENKLRPAMAKIEDRLDVIRELIRLTGINIKDKNTRFTNGILAANELKTIQNLAFIISEKISPRDTKIKAKEVVNNE